MIQSLAAVSFLVPSYEEGLAYFRDVLSFVTLQDVAVGPNKRWVVVAPAGGRGAELVLAVPSNETQRARIGDQTGGRVGYFLVTDDFQSDYELLRSRGVNFLEAPRREPYGQVAVFVDPWGGKWDLLHPTGAAR